jgi:sigma-E factor negative regulatory protein RseA
MSDKLRESVSALIDGETDELELRRVLAAEDFATLRETWGDFHRSRGGLHGVDATIARLDISGRVLSALQDEVQETAVSGSRWWRPVTSVAVAASMAAAVVVGMRSMSGGEMAPGGAAGIAVAAMDSRQDVAGAAPSTTGFANAGRVFAPVPLRGSTVSASVGGVPGHVVAPVSVYGNAQTRAEAEALMRRRLQQYLLMQVDSSSSPTQAAPR